MPSIQTGNPFPLFASRVRLRGVKRSVAGSLFVFLAWLGVPSCKSACPGVQIGQECEKACQDSACSTGQVCIDNACRPTCTSTADCGPHQTCTARVSDHGARGSFCVGPSTEPPKGAAMGTPCTASADCDSRSGARCVDGTCTFTCLAHDDCVTCTGAGRCTSIGSCTGTAKDAEGESVRLCEKDSFPRGPGQFGSPCHTDPCDDANDFTCVGTPGDIDAYCTKNFCGGDADCPSGFYCATLRSSLGPCQSTCNIQVDGAQTNCVAPSDIGPGKHYDCGPRMLTTTRCLHREFCAPCSDDTDCLSVRNQICAKDKSGENICTVLCDDKINSCPWGAAAFCRTTDDSLGAPTCSHRFGSCHGTGKSCEPCVDQKDCPTGMCLTEAFTNEHYCVDFDATCSCPAGTQATCAGGGCPVSPPPALSTLTCYGGDAVKGSALENTCVGSATSPGCWPSL